MCDVPTSAPSTASAFCAPASVTGSRKKHAKYAQLRHTYGRRRSIWHTAHVGYSSRLRFTLFASSSSVASCGRILPSWT